jgi:membrane protein required for colicin V production
MNPFDAAIIGLTLVAVVLGFRAGLLRSLATIFGYLAAAALAVALMPRLAPHIAPLLGQRFNGPAFTMGGQNGLIFAAVFLISGVLLSMLLRLAVSETTGAEVGIADRAGGAMLGAIRIILLAVFLVLMFDRIIPAGQQPEFLAGSRLRPVLSAAGASGLHSLPPDVSDYIDRLKRNRGL